MSPGRKHLPSVIKVNPDSTHSLMSLITLDDESNDFSVNGPSSKRRDSSSRAKLGLWQASMKNDRFAPILNPTQKLSPMSRANKSRLSLPVRKASADCLRMPTFSALKFFTRAVERGSVSWRWTTSISTRFVVCVITCTMISVLPTS